LPDWTEAKRTAGEAGYGIDTKSYERAFNLPSVSDLKALAESHTRLLEAIKGVEGITKPADWDRLDAAIAEAEK
jgi:hypothetical protein